jgi:hypothetical protein
MAQTIVTKYAGPTNYRAARILVRSRLKRMCVLWDDALGVDANHEAEATAMARELGWTCRYVHGELPTGEHVHVPDHRSPRGLGT